MDLAFQHRIERAGRAARAAFHEESSGRHQSGFWSPPAQPAGERIAGEADQHREDMPAVAERPLREQRDHEIAAEHCCEWEPHPTRQSVDQYGGDREEAVADPDIGRARDRLVNGVKLDRRPETARGGVTP